MAVYCIRLERPCFQEKLENILNLGKIRPGNHDTLISPSSTWENPQLNENRPCRYKKPEASVKHKQTPWSFFKNKNVPLHSGSDCRRFLVPGIGCRGQRFDTWRTSSLPQFRRQLLLRSGDRWISRTLSVQASAVSN